VRARWSLLAVAGLILALAASAPTAFAKTRIGPPSLATNGLTNINACSPPCTFIQFSNNGATAAYTSPINGVITSWQLASGSAGNPVRLRVLRPGAAAGTFSGAGTGAAQTTAGGLNQFAGERVPIRAGDSIGLDDAQGLFFATGLAGALAKWWSPALADNGAATAPPNTSPAGYSLQINADVEADVDGDGFGDETQDGCPGDATRQAPPCTTGRTNPIKPIVTQLRAVPRSIRIGQRSAISFRISKAARWTLQFEQARPGRVRAGRCRLQTRRLKTGRRCTNYTSRGRVSGNGGPGKVTLIFQGALANKRSIPTGRYRITATAKDATGTSTPRTTRLTLRPKLRRR